MIHSNVFPFKTPPGWRREERRGEANSKSVGIKFPTTINTWSSNSPCLSLPRENKCVKVRKNALKGKMCLGERRIIRNEASKQRLGAKGDTAA